MVKGIPTIRVDFNNADEDGRIRLNTVATLADLAALGRPLRDGEPLFLVAFELSVYGTACFSPEGIWAAIIDWQDIVSDEITEDPS